MDTENSSVVASVHYMQTPAWADIKSQFGWKTNVLRYPKLVDPIISYGRVVPGVGKLNYIPGLSGIEAPTSDFTNFLHEEYAKHGFVIRLELNQRYDETLLDDLKQQGWLLADKHVQYRHTVVVDLGKPKNDIWMSFKSRGRYEILQAEKAGVVVKEAELTEENFDKMYELMRITSSRNKFFIRDTKFTMAYWHKLTESKQLKLYFATHDGDLLAGAVVITSGELAWYKDGGSVRIKSNLMAPRLLQWEIMKQLKQDGITTYDLGGIPDPNAQKDSSMHGIYVFKSAYSKETVTLMPTLELPLSKRYALWPKAEKQWLRVYNLFAHNLWW